MELLALIRALSDPAAYPFDVQAVEIRQTHISVVCLAGAYVYKIKKPVDLGFLDFGTLAKRRRFCDEEVRLNRRLAPDVYLGVTPIVETKSGVRVEGSGETVEWAVKMRRLPDDATLANRLRRGEVSIPVVQGLAARIAAFHANAERHPRMRPFGSFDAVSRNAYENFEQSRPLVGQAVSLAVFDRFRELTTQFLEQNRALIDGRAARGVPRDTHGDLRLEHVYWFPQHRPPADYVVIDCIEFNGRFRFADPIADMAFLAMDFTAHGRRDLAEAFTSAYFSAADDEEGKTLLPFYVAYRAAVRAKVSGIQSTEAELSAADRAAALCQARQLWLLGWSELEEMSRRPCLVLVGGLPGAGKSTLAAELGKRYNFAIIRSDAVRKELAGLSAQTSAAGKFDEGIYAPPWNEHSYAECLRRAEAQLFEGRRVLIDASFREDAKRKLFLNAAKRWGVPFIFLVCRADETVVHERLSKRRNDASDADWAIYLKAAKAWDAPSSDTLSLQRVVNANGTPEQTLERAIVELRAAGIV